MCVVFHGTCWKVVRSKAPKISNAQTMTMIIKCDWNWAIKLQFGINLGSRYLHGKLSCSYDEHTIKTDGFGVRTRSLQRPPKVSFLE